jgi:hypothetical protein
LLVIPEIVLSNAPLLKNISGDLAALRQHAFWMLLVWVALSAAALGIGRQVSVSIVQIDISKLAPSLCLLAFFASVGWLYLAGDLTANSISGYKDRLPILDLSSARGAATVRLIIELMDGGFGLDAECAIDPTRGASFIGSNLCWSASAAQTMGMFAFFLMGCLTVVLIFRAIYLKSGKRHEAEMALAAAFCIIISTVALAYKGIEVFTAAETTILHELQRAAAAQR